MLVITEYFIFVIEVKNRNGKLQLNRWSDEECLIAGEKTYSPVMQNEKHITVLKQYICDYFHDLGDHTSYDWRFVNIVAKSPFTEVAVSFDADEYDNFIMDSTAQYIIGFSNISKIINDHITDFKNSKDASMEPINMEKCYNALLKFSSFSPENRSLKMRYREEANKHTNKHSWKYYIGDFGDDSNPFQTIVRDNGINKQSYRERSGIFVLCGGFWNVRGLDEKVKIIKNLTTTKEIMEAKQFFDDDDNFPHVYIKEIEKEKESNTVYGNINNAINAKSENMDDKREIGISDEMEYCPSCGKKIKRIKFCPFCGYEL